jgi:hypothetical protein
MVDVYWYKITVKTLCSLVTLSPREELLDRKVGGSQPVWMLWQEKIAVIPVN